MNKIITIIITYNGSKWIKKCLEHLLESVTDTDIMVIDNNSSDKTLEVLDPFLKNIELIRLPSNLGFGGANNIGMQKALNAGYSHIFLLNQDAYIRQDTISKLLTTASENPEYGILSPIQLDSSGQSMDQVFRKQVKKYYNPDAPKLKKDLSQKKAAEVKEVRFVGAASWFLTAGVLRKIGLFHPVFFHYGEDNNFAARAQYFGFKIGIQSTTAIIHDRKPRDLSGFLPIKLRSFPLHQLLDIRKPFLVAWIVGYNQLLRTWKKLKKTNGNQDKNQFLETRKWFFSNIADAMSIRNELKKGYE